MTEHYANETLSNGARVTVRPVVGKGARKAFRWAVFNAGQATPVAKGDDLCGPQGLPGLPSGREMICALLSFAAAYAEAMAYGNGASELSASDQALAAWYDANEAEISEWQMSNDASYMEGLEA